MVSPAGVIVGSDAGMFEASMTAPARVSALRSWGARGTVTFTVTKSKSTDVLHGGVPA